MHIDRRHDVVHVKVAGIDIESAIVVSTITAILCFKITVDIAFNMVIIISVNIIIIFTSTPSHIALSLDVNYRCLAM